MKEFIKEAGCGMLILAVLLSFFIWLCWEDIGGLYGLLYHLLFVWYFLILLGVAGLLDAITRSRQSRWSVKQSALYLLVITSACLLQVYYLMPWLES
jgi:hypothetical protein